MTFDNHYTSLEFLTDAPLHEFSINLCSCGTATEFLIDKLRELRPVFRQHVQFTGAPFIMESNEGFRRMKEVLPREPIVQTGTWITLFGEDFWTFFYELNLQPGVTVKWKGDVTVLLASTDPLYERGTHLSLTRRRIEEMTEKRFEDLDAGMDLPLIVVNLLNLIIFSRYCGWENRMVLPGKKATLFDTEYKNETPFPIGVMDSPLFNELMQNKEFREGSKKGGFFRMQRQATSGGDQKLIWVKPRAGRGIFPEVPLP